MAGDRFYPEERLIKIMELVKKSHTIDVETLSHMFSLTGATIRSDLRELENRGLVKRTHGGAILREIVDEHLKMDRDPAYENRLIKHAAEKEAIGKACVALIQPYDCIALDDGTTTLQVLRHIDAEREITILTNGLSACTELINRPNVNVICTGGFLTKDSLAFQGKTAEETICKFNTSCAVLGASGITVKDGVTAPDELRAEMKKQMIRNTVKLIIVADHSKLTRVSLIPVCQVDIVDILVTDSNAPEELLEQFYESGMEVIVAPV